MSDELNVWTFECCYIPSEIHSAEYAKRYQKAIADVVEWLGRGGASTMPRMVIAGEITRRFGKDA